MGQALPVLAVGINISPLVIADLLVEVIPISTTRRKTKSRPWPLKSARRWP